MRTDNPEKFYSKKIQTLESIFTKCLNKQSTYLGIKAVLAHSKLVLASTHSTYPPEPRYGEVMVHQQIRGCKWKVHAHGLVADGEP
jgi:hypothetical protein